MDVWVVAKDTGKRKLLIKGAADARFVRTGHLGFVREGRVMLAAFDPDRLELTGAEFPILESVIQSLYGGNSPTESRAAHNAVSETGILAHAPRPVLSHMV